MALADETTHFIDAIIEGKEQIKICDVHINARDSYGWTALMYAAAYGHNEIVVFLVDEGADLNVKCMNGKTVLLYASRRGHGKIIDYLLHNPLHEKRVNLGVQDLWGRTALMLGCMWGHIDVVKVLIKAGVSQNIQDEHTLTAGDFARHKYHEDIINFLGDCRGPLSLKHTILNLIEKNGTHTEGLPPPLFIR